MVSIAFALWQVHNGLTRKLCKGWITLIPWRRGCGRQEFGRMMDLSTALRVGGDGLVTSPRWGRYVIAVRGFWRWTSQATQEVHHERPNPFRDSKGHAVDGGS